MLRRGLCAAARLMAPTTAPLPSRAYGIACARTTTIFSTSAVQAPRLLTLTRQFHASSSSCSTLRTKQAAAKRFIKTGSGKLKYGHAGKSHLNNGKSRKLIRKLNQKGTMTGVWEKKMKSLIICGK